MTSSKSTKRALLASVLSVALCCVMLIGSTFAWFTDSVTSAGNKIVAGNLKVDLIHVGGGENGGNVSIKDNPDHKIFNYDKWEPGYTAMETLQVVNKGNLALKFRLDAVADGAAAAETGEKLSDVIDVWVYEGEGIPTTQSFAEMSEDADWRNAGSLSALMADTDGIAHGVLLPDGETAKQENEVVGSVQMTVALHMQESAGNAYQGLTLGDLNFTLNATQYTYEKDGFGNKNYDADAEPALAGFINQMEEGGYVVMPADVALPMESDVTDGSVDPLLTVTEETTLNLAGKELTLDYDSEMGSLPYTPALVSVNSGSLTVSGDGVVNAEAGYNTAYGICVNGGQLVINGGSYYGAMCAVQVQKGSVVINGGFFDLASTIKQAAPDYVTYLINCIDSAYKDGSATVSIRGGTFVNFDPSNNGAEGAGTNFVAEGYTVVSEKQANGETWYTVVSQAVSGEDIEAALNDPDVTEVFLGGDIDMNDDIFKADNGNATFNVPDGKTLNMLGNRFTRPDRGSGNGLTFAAGVTAAVKNGIISNDSDMTMVDIGEGATVTFENITFEGFGGTPVRVRAAAGEKTTVVFENCIFENAPVQIAGRNGATEVDVQFVDCEFTGVYKILNSDGTPATDPYGNAHYTNMLIDAEASYLYGNILLQNCTLSFDASGASYKQDAIGLYGCDYPDNKLNVTLENVTVTTQNADPVSVDSRYEDGLVITEKGTNSYTVDGTAVDYKGD